MSIVHFFFGHGWWMALYGLTYGWLALTVGLFLLVFGQDLKAPGEAPDLASPASFMVLMICFGLAVMTACFVGVGIGLRAGVLWGVVVAFVCSAIVLVADGWLNIQLAEQQNGFWFRINLAAVVAVILANLAVMHIAINRPIEPPPLPQTVMAI